MNIPTPKLSTLGCRLNAYETEAMRELATSSGLSDAVIINTCAVTSEAVRKSKQEVRKLRKENPNAKVIVTGCAAQIEPNSFASMTEVTKSLVPLRNFNFINPLFFSTLKCSFLLLGFPEVIASV